METQLTWLLNMVPSESISPANKASFDALSQFRILLGKCFVNEFSPKPKSKKVLQINEYS